MWGKMQLIKFHLDTGRFYLFDFSTISVFEMLRSLAVEYFLAVQGLM